MMFKVKWGQQTLDQLAVSELSNLSSANNSLSLATRQLAGEDTSVPDRRRIKKYEWGVGVLVFW